ncbi:MAG: DUF4065 domain-containing protein [Candidatus Pacebacteria bacterium]|nr:DUF4065 domain-containing protein [Candidatus Paceibacterota bacterium]
MTTEYKKSINGNIDVFDVANYFIHLSLKNKVDDDGTVEGITHLKLQKILYFAQCAYLSLYNKPLFDDEIKAWQYGPVISSIYDKYKVQENKILQKDKNFNENTLDEDIKDFLDDIWNYFSKFSTTELVNITHMHAPWKNAYTGDKDSVIENEVLRQYYKGIFKLEDCA